MRRTRSMNCCCSAYSASCGFTEKGCRNMRQPFHMAGRSRAAGIAVRRLPGANGGGFLKTAPVTPFCRSEAEIISRETTSGRIEAAKPWGIPVRQCMVFPHGERAFRPRSNNGSQNRGNPEGYAQGQARFVSGYGNGGEIFWNTMDRH